MDPQISIPQVDPTQPVDPKAQVLERLKGSVNVLVTVSNNPSVDQLSAAIGFTLVLNKLKKHGTAVFSGQTPSTIEFLQPDKTFEKNTDSLRDFIVSLDKSKADKLRYKIEDKYVKIFITPYHTSLTEQDLEFGQGDLNVDVIIALGVGKRDELDQAITAHGRILHDATIISITREPGDDIGAINWHVPEASSFSEILVGVSDALKGSPQTELFDQQIATAFLTGIVAETERFSNDRTTPQTMTTAAILMRAGANQQLIANQLEEPQPMLEEGVLPKPNEPIPFEEAAPPPPPPENKDGSLEVPHNEPEPAPAPLPELQQLQEPEPPKEPEPDPDNIHIDNEGTLLRLDELNAEANKGASQPIEEAMTLPSVSPAPVGDLGVVSDQPAGDSTATSDPSVVNPTSDHEDQTLEEIEQAVHSPHLANSFSPPKEDSPVPPHISETEARQHVAAAEDENTPEAEDPLAPIKSLNAIPVDLDMGHGDQPDATPSEVVMTADPGTTPDTSATPTAGMVMPTDPVIAPDSSTAAPTFTPSPDMSDQNVPPVPPPFTPPPADPANP